MLSFWRALLFSFIAQILLVVTPIIGKVSPDARANNANGIGTNDGRDAVGNGTTGTSGNQPSGASENSTTDALGNGPTDAIGNWPTAAFGNLSTDAVENGTTDALGNLPTDAFGNNATESDALGNGTTDALGDNQATSHANGATDDRENGTAAAYGNVTTVASGNEPAHARSRGNGQAGARGIGKAFARGIGKAGARGIGKFFARGIGQARARGIFRGTGQAGDRGNGQPSARGIGKSFARGIGQAGARGIFRGNAQAGDRGNGQTSARGNGQAFARGNGKSVARGIGPVFSRGNGQALARGVGKSVARGIGPVVARGNGQTGADARGNGQDSARGIGRFGFGRVPLSDKNSAIVRKKRSSEEDTLKEAFNKAFWRIIDPKTGQIRTNAAADTTGLELGENSVFTMIPSNCYDDCPCKWGNCIRVADGPIILKAADECCAGNHQFKCCQIPDLFPENMTAITEYFQSKCIKTVPFDKYPISRDECSMECYYGHFEVVDDANRPHTKTAKIHSSESEKQKIDECIRRKGEEVPALLDDSLSHFFFEHPNCSRCGWAVCYHFSFSCKCCDYEALTKAEWRWTSRCNYLPEADDPKCASCKWKMRNNFFHRDSCCDLATLKKCLRTTPVGRDKDFQNVSRTEQCANLIKYRCECGYGVCKPRRGRAANTCCEEHNDLACCIEGTQWASDGINATVEPFKVLMLMVLIVFKLTMSHILDNIMM